LGQKTHPIGFRLGVIKSWNSKWFAQKNFASLLEEDILIRKYTEKRLEHAGISKIVILRAPKRVTIDIHTAKPGVVIGRKGAEVDKIREELRLLTGKEIQLNIIEVKIPELDAMLVAKGIARQLEGRISFRRAMKKSITSAMKLGAEGIKVMCGGRLGGAEIARSEKYHQGRVPLHTLRADIDYATATAHTTYGCIGVKVWICKGEILETKEEDEITPHKRYLKRKKQGPRRPDASKRRKRRRRKKRVEDDGNGQNTAKDRISAADSSKTEGERREGQAKAEPYVKAKKSPDKSSTERVNKKEDGDVNA